MSIANKLIGAGAKGELVGFDHDSCTARLLALILNVEQGDSRWLTVIQFTIGRSNHDPNQSEVNQVPLMLSTDVHDGSAEVAKGSAKVGGGDEGQQRWQRGRQRSVEVTKVSRGGEGCWRWRRLLEVAKVVGGGEGCWRWQRLLEVAKVVKVAKVAKVFAGGEGGEGVRTSQGQKVQVDMFAACIYPMVVIQQLACTIHQLYYLKIL
ncbi:hypothetical protein B0H13DRAFT_1934065 [Mycena leptocephala]|nr:hypothetical protein B0H13DRAFT_1934065 [Mycena leptocephala]